jgi:integrase
VVDIGPRGIPGNQVMRGGFATEEAARAAMHTLQHDVRIGEYVPATDVSVRDYSLGWIPSRRREVRDHTVETYRSDLNRILPLIGDIPVQSLTQRVLADAYRTLADRGYKSTTIKKSHTVLKSALQQAVDDGLLKRNPAYRAFRLRVPLEETESLTESEAYAFLGSEEGMTEYPAWRLFLTEGLRPGELCALLDRDVNLVDGWLIVRQGLSLKSRSEGEPGPKFQYQPDDPKSPAARRRRDLDARTTSVLRAYRESREAQQEAMGAAFQDRGFFFATPDGRPWNPANLAGLFRRRLEKSGVRPVRLYDLRHTAASIASWRGVPIREVAEMLGHASIRSTMRYIHLMPGSSARTSGIVASAIDGAGPD